MLWFNVNVSTLWFLYKDFNTSYVVVQHLRLLESVLLGIISIHLMLWFNCAVFLTLGKFILFQYILCCGSTILIQKVWYLLITFQYILCCGSTLGLYNTPIRTLSHFNTSYVVVQRQSSSHSQPSSSIFQYILCCGSTC